MAATEHSEYVSENDNLLYTKEYVKKTLGKTILEKSETDKKVDYGMKHFNADASQEYIDLIVNSKLQGYQVIKVINLSKAVQKPYFARIDFMEKGSRNLEKLYIGKVSLSRDEDEKLLIVDWRAPISNLYYEGRLGEASYVSPDGEVGGNLSLKRQFTIDKGELKEIFDIDITTNDQLLQSCLGASADNRLKDIVSTIQEEQNRIVRADMWKPLIVQGVAGSGKTTIALHRIAYLVYTFERSFDPESFMIIAPNRLFLNYISEVLPELGVDRVKQTTFRDFAMELLRKRFKIQDENEKLVRFSESTDSTEKNLEDEKLIACSKLKCSMEFKNILDGFIEKIGAGYIPRKNFSLGGQMIYTYEEINRLFLEEYRRWPFTSRINEIKKHLAYGVKKTKQQLMNEIQEKAYEFLYKVKNSSKSSDDQQNLIQRLYMRQEEAIQSLEKKSKKIVSEYIRQIEKKNPFEYYKDFLNLLPDITADSNELTDIIPFLKKHTLTQFSKGYIELEDLAPMIYLKYRIYGMDEKIPVRHIIIDEAQDFSAFQIYVLKKIIKDSSFTILGDLCQGIHSYRGIHSWDDVRHNVFNDRECEILTLKKSYRTTVEIMETANRVIGHLEDENLLKAQPVIRHGECVKIIRKKDIRDIADAAADIINKETREVFRSAAIICKTIDECGRIYDILKNSVKNLHVITGKEKEYKSGIVIVPSYLSKGLEFDIVIIANANSYNYRINELDIKLLYVSMTRPLHKLFIFYTGELSPALGGISDKSM